MDLLIRLQQVAPADAKDLFSLEFASWLDDASANEEGEGGCCCREDFVFPLAPASSGRERVIYLCGNSLGLQPKGVKVEVLKQLEKWGEEGVEGHFTEPTPWLTIDDTVQESMARVVGALPSEVVVMNSLTCNLHFMMAAFFTPTLTRNKIFIEKKAFPSDVHAVVSQLLHHHLDPATCLIEIAPREGEVSLRQEDIEAVIESQGEQIALILLSGVQYYTGQFFQLQAITQAGHAKGCIVGFDLAHAVGNVPLELHAWGCDFACWCTYKYMNCGPGSIGGCFVHERHGQAEHVQQAISGTERDGSSSAGDGSSSSGAGTSTRTRLAGWWGHRLVDRFVMDPTFISCQGAYGYRVSNPPVLLVACVRASLDVFEKAGGMERLRKRSLLLTGYLEALLTSQIPEGEVVIFTPTNAAERGCQLSLSFKKDIDAVFNGLKAAGIMCDVRKPNVMRVAPAPLYNSAVDVFEFVSILKATLEAIQP